MLTSCTVRMEKRFIVPLALFLALVTMGGIFYGIGRQASVLPARLAGGPTVTESPQPTVTPTPTPMAETDQAHAVTEDAPAMSADTPTLPASKEPSAPIVAGAQHVSPSAMSGGGGALLIASGTTLFLGITGLEAARWYAIKAKKYF